MPDVRVKNSLKFAGRMSDITSWQTGDITSLSPREEKRYYKRKSAIEEYFTTEASMDEIARRYRFSPKMLLELAEKCLMQHEDGGAWGFRALLPGVAVVDHAADNEDTAKRRAVKPPLQTPVLDMDVPETPIPPFMKDEDEEEETTRSLVEVGVERPAVISEVEMVDQVIQEREEEIVIEEMPASAEATAPLGQEVPGIDNATGMGPLGGTRSFASAQDDRGALDDRGVGNVTQDDRGVGDDKGVDDDRGVGNATGNGPLRGTRSFASAQDDRGVGDDKGVGNDKGVDDDRGACNATGNGPLGGTRSFASAQDDKGVDDDRGVGNATRMDPLGGTRSFASAQDDRGADDDRGIDEDKGAGNATQDDKGVGNATRMDTLVVPIPLRNGIYSANKQVIQRRLAYKRWQRGLHDRQKHARTLRIARLVIVAAIVLFVLLPAGAGVAAFSAYNNINAMAHDGLNHLLKVKSLLNVSKSDPTAALNVTKLQQAQVEFKGAEVDFVQLQQLVDRPDIQGAITQFAPQYGTKLDELISLAQVAVDVSRMGDELSGVGLIGANILHASPLTAGSNKPLITASDVLAIEGAMVHALYYISDIRTQMSHISLKDLPISNSQKTQLASLLPLLPKAQDTIVQAQGLVGLVSWLLGVGQPRRFLIQTMDSAELRPGGGFTGQYGIVQIQDGRVTPPSLTDVTLLDYAGNGTAIGRTAPAGYSWMNFGNWGIRDSNLSGDFPTTARMTMQLFQDEGGGPIDGDIAFTPTLIGHIIDVTGPIKVPGYNETITSKNLEDRLHYYQQDFSAIAREKQISGNYSHSGRKAFTSTLGKILLDHVRHLPVKQLMEVVKGAIKDIQSHDLQMYFTDPAVEGWLVQHGYSGSTDTFSKQDGFIVVQANISISKASQYVHTTEQDNVTLDAQGGATHNLTITLNYQQKGPVYGYDTYADYIRVYAPQNAQFISGDGFDSGHALCTPGTPKPSTGTNGTPPTAPPTTGGCGQYSGYFPSSARYCPNGNYSLGMRGFTTSGGTLVWPVDSLGPPTALTSDLPGRAMWGGLTETPKNCTSTITVSWYVPHAVKKVNGQPSYTILVQKQAGLIPTIELAIDASAIKGLKNFNFKGDINTDRYFVVAVPPKK